MRSWLTVLLVCLGLAVNSQIDVTLTPEQLQQDFEQFQKKVVKLNAGLTHFVDIDSLQRHWQTLELQLNKEMAVRDFNKILNQAIQPVGERHMSIGIHKKSQYALDFKSGKRKYFPLVIYYAPEEEKTYVVRNLSSDSLVHHKATLQSINGRSHLEIRDSIFKYLNSDAQVKTWKPYEYNGSFAKLYHHFVDTSSTYNISYIDSLGLEKRSTIKGITTKKYVDSLNKLNKEIYNLEKQLPAIYTKFYDSLSTGYLRIKTFNKQKIKKGESKFKPDIEDFFTTVREENIEHVVIDLRNNTGGRIRYLLDLLSYMQTNSGKLEAIDRTYYPLLSRNRKTNQGKTHKKSEPAFNGQVYVINNGGSYSASVTFTSLAKELADIITFGEESGGRYDGTTAGSFKIVKLKNSKLTVRIPMILMTYRVAEQQAGRGVLPDYDVKRHVDDYFSIESDQVLQYVLDFIDSEQETTKR